jgi:hypothetical protein
VPQNATDLYTLFQVQNAHSVSGMIRHFVHFTARSFILSSLIKCPSNAAALLRRLQCLTAYSPIPFKTAAYITQRQAHEISCSLFPNPTNVSPQKWPFVLSLGFAIVLFLADPSAGMAAA